MKPRITEKEWLRAKTELDLDLYRTTHGQLRKWRLFGCACARRTLKFLPDPRFAAAVEAAERFADGELTWDDVKLARKAATAARKVIEDDLRDEQECAIEAVFQTTEKKPLTAMAANEPAAFAFAEVTRPFWDKGHDAEQRVQVRLAHDIFGNPFRPVAFDPAWRTSDAVALARQMYESRDFAALPILADALQDAGCEDAAVLTHCRGRGPHVRGCWVVDLVLGKS